MASSSENHVRYAATMFQKQLAPLITMTPYSNSFYHASALLHPFSHGLKALVGLGRSVAGLYENSEEAPPIPCLMRMRGRVVRVVPGLGRPLHRVFRAGRQTGCWAPRRSGVLIHIFVYIVKPSV